MNGQLSRAGSGALIVGPGEELTWSGGEVSDISVRGGVLNVIDGIVGYLDVGQGGKAAITGGLVPFLDVNPGGQVIHSGGEVGFIAGFGGSMETTGGSVYSSISLEYGSQYVQRGGTLFPDGSGIVQIYDGGTWTIRGGDPGFDSSFLLEFLAGSRIELYGTNFALDGVPITGLVQDIPEELLSRDALLSGLLEDGTAFSLYLSTAFPPSFLPNTASVEAGARIYLVSVVPEPAWVGLSLLTLVLGHGDGVTRERRVAPPAHRIV